jgi:predicted nucleotidyltransferase
MSLEQSKIDSIKKYFKTKPVLRAYLFGSYSRNTNDKDSDVDLLVELDYSQKIGLQFVQMKLDLEQILESKVDLVSSKSLSKHILPQVEKEKSLIYAR